MPAPEDILLKISNNNLTRRFSKNEGGFQEVFYTQPFSVTASSQLVTFLRNGGVKEMETAVGTLGTPVNFDYTVPAGDLSQITALEIIILDGGIQPRRFGGEAELINGLLIQAIDANGTTVLKDFLDGEAIKKNSDFSWLAGVNSLMDPSGFDMFSARWTIREAGTSLTLNEGQRLRISFRDDMTGVESMVAVVKGSTFTK